MMLNMVPGIPGTFPNMAAVEVVDNMADYPKARLADMRTLTAVQFSAPEVCRDRWGNGIRSRVGNHGNRAAWYRPGCLGMRVLFFVRRLQLASSFVSFVCFGTKFLPVC